MAQHISIIGAAFAGGKALAITSDAGALATALGHPPVRFADFVRKHRDQFAHTAA